MRTSNAKSRQGLVGLQRLRQRSHVAVLKLAVCAPTQIHAVVQTHVLARRTHANCTDPAAAQVHMTSKK
eukprot:5619313-Pleurochrysis_carterae.AAC.2